MIEDKNGGNKKATAEYRDETPSDSGLHETDDSSTRNLQDNKADARPQEIESSSTGYQEGVSTDSSPQETETSSTEYLADASSDPELHESGAAARLPEDEGLYTYADYYSWDDDKRWELIDGVAYAMAAPTAAHQRISRELISQFHGFLRGKPCEVFSAPFDVRLFANQDDETDESDDTVVQPDLLVVCDSSKLSDGRSCKGAPDLVVEILSPSTASRDRIVKLQKYLEAGVREYWIVDPNAQTVRVFLLKDGKFTRRKYGETDIVPVTVLPGLTINLPDVFAEMV